MECPKCDENTIKCPKCTVNTMKNGFYINKDKLKIQRYYCKYCELSFVENIVNDNLKDIYLKDIFKDNKNNLKEFYENLLIKETKNKDLQKLMEKISIKLFENNIPIKIIYELFNKRYSIRTLQRIKKKIYETIDRDYIYIYNEKYNLEDINLEKVLNIENIKKLFENYEKESLKMNNFINDLNSLYVIAPKNTKNRGKKIEPKKPIKIVKK